MELPQIEVVKAAVSLARVGYANAAFAVLCTEEAGKISDLIWVTDETIDFLVHEVDEDFAIRLRQNPFHEREGSAGPAEWVDESKGWK